MPEAIGGYGSSQRTPGNPDPGMPKGMKGRSVHSKNNRSMNKPTLSMKVQAPKKAMRQVKTPAKGKM